MTQGFRRRQGSSFRECTLPRGRASVISRRRRWIPNAHYTDPAMAAAELRTTFSAPLLVAPSSTRGAIGPDKIQE